jgi:hypothetical protein
VRGLRGGSSRSSGGGRQRGGGGATGARPPDAALGRATRGLVGRSRAGGGGGIGTGPRAVGRRLRAAPRLVTPARAAGLLGLIATGFLFTLATGPTAFAVSRTVLPSLTWTDAAALRGALGAVEGGNALRLDTAPLEAALARLPGVAAAQVSVQLPDGTIVVAIEERRPVLAWQIRDRRFIADAEGVIFAEVPASEPLPAGVAIVDDRRQGAISLHAVGGRLDPIDLDVATRLGSLVPADVGSSAAALRVAVTDADGFIVTTRGWTAVFGLYSPATRPTDIVPGQVRLLRSLLAGRESAVRRIILASETDGTYVPRATPRPSAR